MIPITDDGPVATAFESPWHASAFSLAVLLNERGHFTWREWSSALGRELAEADGEAGLGEEDRYYSAWLRALERMIAERGLTKEGELSAEIAEWRSAHLGTPHGSPVKLRRPEAKRERG